jgi:ATP-dependent Clp protease ATP-binding subunit ClpC
LTGQAKAGDLVTIGAKKGKLTFTVKSPEAKTPVNA